MQKAEMGCEIADHEDVRPSTSSAQSKRSTEGSASGSKRDCRNERRGSDRRRRSRSPQRHGGADREGDRNSGGSKLAHVSPKHSQRNERDKAESPLPAKPNFGLSGRLAEEANKSNGTVLKYSEPPEARKPTKHWRIYVFKDGKDIDLHHVNKASGYLFGRDRKVADIPVDHPSCSGQHAVLQFRQAESNVIKPYIIDLASTNGTLLNGKRIPSQRYIELISEDVVKFGFSTREYVLLCE